MVQTEHLKHFITINIEPNTITNATHSLTKYFMHFAYCIVQYDVLGYIYILYTIDFTKN